MRTCNDLMTKDPSCCLAADPIHLAAKLMKEEDVGSVPVIDSDSNNLIGILTDRDIVVKIVADGNECATAHVEDVMTRNPLTCRPEDDIQDALDRMSEHQIRRIPVVDVRGRIVGIISQADLALRMEQPKKVEKVLEHISQPISV